MASIVGTSGNDTLIGENDPDVWTSSDTLRGGAGNDYLDGRAGRNLLLGEDGDDYFFVAPGPVDKPLNRIDGGAGFDTLEIGATDYHLRLSDYGPTGDAFLAPSPQHPGLEAKTFVESFVNIERIIIAGDDRAGSSINLFNSSKGYEFVTRGSAYVSTGTGDDTIIGGPGRDSISLRGGNDIASGGAGSDEFYVAYVSGNADRIEINGGPDRDTLLFANSINLDRDVTVDLTTGTASAGATSIHFTGIEVFAAYASRHAVTIFGDATDNELVTMGSGASIEVHGGGGNDLLWSQENGDRLFGDDGDDRIVTSIGSTVADGGAGNDSLTGSLGDDQLAGGEGMDHIEGGYGHDWLYGASGASDRTGDADTLSGGGGNDHIYGHSPSSINNAADGGDLIDAADGSDYVNGNGGNDSIDGGIGSDRLQGGQGDDRIFGGADFDQINGNRGSDTIDGGDGDDIIRGGQGDDDLSGGAGNDILMGDLGTDRLTGGNGADIFLFGGSASLHSSASPDVLTDYQDGTDRIHVAYGVDAVLTAASQGSFAAAAATAQQLFDGRAGGGEVAALIVGADTFVFYSGVNGGAADSAIQLVGVDAATLTAGDFI